MAGHYQKWFLLRQMVLNGSGPTYPHIQWVSGFKATGTWR